MRCTVKDTGDLLVNALHALGVIFLMDSKGADESLHKQPARLIAALAKSGETRLRLSLIPFFERRHKLIARFAKGLIYAPRFS